MAGGGDSESIKSTGERLPVEADHLPQKVEVHRMLPFLLCPAQRRRLVFFQERDDLFTSSGALQGFARTPVTEGGYRLVGPVPVYVLVLALGFFARDLDRLGGAPVRTILERCGTARIGDLAREKAEAVAGNSFEP